MLKTPTKGKVQIEVSKAELFQYLRDIYQELLRLEGKLHSPANPPKDQEKPKSEGISAFTFFKFSKLPRLLSDALYRSTSERGSMTLPQFQRIFQILAFGQTKEQIALIFMLLDADKDVSINREDCRLILSQIPIPGARSLSSHSRFELQAKAQVQIDAILDNYFTEQSPSINFEKFLLLSNTQTADVVLMFLNYFSTHFHILERAKAHTRRTTLDLSSCALLTQATLTYIKPRAIKLYLPSSDSSATKPNEENIEPRNRACSHQGSLYRVMDKSTLKQYWYELRDQCLYMYRRQEDATHKAFIYLGVGSHVRSIETVQESYDGLFKVYGFELVTPNKCRKFFHIDFKQCEAWYNAIVQACEMNGSLSDKYQMKERIANGTEGTVWRAIRTADEQSVAIKVVKKSKLDQDSLISLHHQVEILMSCSHQHIVECYDVIEDEEHVYIVMEHMKGGTLRHYMMTRKRHISEEVIAKIGHQLIMALYYLSQMSVVHRDIKPDNILIKEPVTDPFDIHTAPEIKLMDFGLSQYLGGNEKSTLPFGTLTYVAPQVISIIPYRFQVDMYSVGIVLYQLCTGHVPFDSSDEEHLIEQENNLIISLIQFEVPDYSDKGGFSHISQEGREIIAEMLQKSGKKRLRPQHALLSGWLTSNNRQLQQRREEEVTGRFKAFAAQ